jgi:hypothetical protein
MIHGSVKIHTRFDKLEPATRNNLDWFGFGYLEKHMIHVPYWAKMRSYDVKIAKQDKADPNQSELGKIVLHEFKHKVKTQSNTW